MLFLGCTMECESCHLAMRKIPNSTFNYSDHEGVAAELVIKPNVTGMYGTGIMCSKPH